MARVYIASLADYNNGHLRGEWFDLDDYDTKDELLEAVAWMLKGYDEKYGCDFGQKREEWAAHDSEDLPDSFYSESMDFAAAIAYSKAVRGMKERTREAYDAFIAYGNDPENFDDRYRGYYGGDSSYDDDKTAATYAEEQLYECISEADIPASVRNYIDFVSMGRDYVLGGDIWIESGHVFLS